MTRQIGFSLILGLLVAAKSFATEAVDLTHFPMQSKSLGFRFNQSFFDVVGDLLEQIAKASGLINEKNQIVFKAQDGVKESFIEYSDIRSQFQLYQGALRGTFKLNIRNALVYKDAKKNNCKITMKGPLTVIITAVVPYNREAKVTLDQFDDRQIDYGSKNCGFFTGTIGINSGLADSWIKEGFEEALYESFYTLFNKSDLAIVQRLAVADAFRKANIYLNQASQTFTPNSQLTREVTIDLGIAGQLSNSKTQRLLVTNPRTPWMNQLGMEWTLDSGVQAQSHNIMDPNYQPAASPSHGNFLPWGLAPYNINDRAMDFDVGFMVKESFAANLFQALYAAGFFNMQIQESLLNDGEGFSISPFSPKSPLQVTLPDGQPLAKEDFQDARLEINFMAPPTVKFGANQEIILQIPKFRGQYYVKAKSSDTEHSVVKFQAEFQLMSKFLFSSDGRLKFDFSSRPVRNFKILSRSGMSQSMNDGQIETQMNQQISLLLSKVDVKIPFLQNRSLLLQYLGIDGRSEMNEDKSLAVYIKVK